MWHLRETISEDLLKGFDMIPRVKIRASKKPKPIRAQEDSTGSKRGGNKRRGDKRRSSARKASQINFKATGLDASQK